MIYLDHNATTGVAPEAIEAILAALKNGPSNPSSKHRAGECCKEAVMQARGELGQLLNCTPPELVYTSCGTEANHFAIQGALAMQPDRRHIVASSVEHPSVMELLAHLEKQGVKVTYVPVDDKGQLDAAAVEAAMTAETALVTVMWANNETGVLMPIEAIAAATKARGILFHTDAVQAAGKVAIDLKAVPVDMLSLSGHKLHAPTGIGALFVRKGLKIPSLFHGHQERARRGGTENVPGIVGLGKAALLAKNELANEQAHLAALRDKLEAGVLERVPIARVNGAGAVRVSNTTFIRFGDLEAELILERLDRAGVCASAGAACTSSGTAPSHVLLAMGVDERGALASVRFSLGRDNTAADIDTLLDILPGIVNEAAAIAA
ncbi:cysteine desulfurase family protein [Methylovirgula sp. HY1]|uniref:cysteine desulfurase family protein n=1 Tax=Methylovirgula sp. HY1 TaxID=2822761 RepID=UPI001C5B29C1|nr:aminotransferase class V-fold PLP-dependent enzyme [Methylovirgula sp. HY1]QXX74968.1 Cysteine desulfurase NifS [Methylovirgula sp. HY1]